VSAVQLYALGSSGLRSSRFGSSFTASSYPFRVAHRSGVGCGPFSLALPLECPGSCFPSGSDYRLPCSSTQGVEGMGVKSLLIMSVLVWGVACDDLVAGGRCLFG